MNENDWTEENSSELFLELVDEVEELIRSSAHFLINGQLNNVARHIVGMLAHKHRLAPPCSKAMHVIVKWPGELDCPIMLSWCNEDRICNDKEALQAALADLIADKV